jgi:polygalacturonase
MNFLLFNPGHAEAKFQTMISMNRRHFLAALPAAGALRSWAAESGWQAVPAILARIRPPRFAARDFPLTRFGAAAGKDASASLRAAIDACAKAGGGRVVVPEGEFSSGPIHLKSNVNLHLASGAIIRFSRNPADYLPAVFTRWEGMECLGYSPFVYAYNQSGIAITGAGTLDGQADCKHWWPWKGRTECGWTRGEPHQEKARKELMALCEQGVAPEKRLFADASLLRPQFIQTYRCRDVLIEGVTIRNSPMWEINPVLSTNVTVRKVTVISHGPNNDGCNPESCRDVLIEDCLFDTGDDCIAIKSGRNADGRRLAVPSENVVIRNCQMKDGHGGVTIGSEMSGGVRNVFAERCRMDSPNLDRVLRIKTNSVRGGFVEGVYMRDVEVGQVADAIVHVDFHYEEGDTGSHPPRVRDIELSGVRSKKSRYGLYLRGYAKAPIENVRLERCVFENVARADVLEHVNGLVRG